MPKTIFVDFINGSDGNNGTSFALRVKTLSRADNLSAPGDTVRVMGNAPTSSGMATWTNNSPQINLSAALSQLLYANGAWTAAPSGVVCAAYSSTSALPKHREGTNCCKFTTSGFTSGKVAHFPLGASLNLSAFQQISFWIQCDSTINDGTLSINLCSDTAGNTIVDTLTLNVRLNANKWTNVTINKGSALGAAIQSIRLTANSTFNNRTLYIDDILACKSPSSPDCLTLGTLISPDGATWYHIQSINGTTVFVDKVDDTNAGSAPGYQGPTGTTTLYLLRPTQVDIGIDSTQHAQTFTDNGAIGNPITISGGWDSTSMSTQNGWTTIDKMDWSSCGFRLSGNNGYLTLDHFNFVRCAEAITPDYESSFYTEVKGYTLSNCTFAGVKNMPIFTFGANYDRCNFLNMGFGLGWPGILIGRNSNYLSEGFAWSVTNCKLWGSVGITVESQLSSPGIKIAGCNCSGNFGGGFGIYSACRGGFYDNIANNNGGAGFSFGVDLEMRAVNLIARGNADTQVNIDTASVEIFGLDTNTPGGSSVPQITVLSGRAVVYDWVQYTGVSPVAVLFKVDDGSVPQGNQIFSQRENGNVAQNSVYSSYGIVTTNGVVSQSGTGLAWRISPNAFAFASSPVRLKVGQIVCPANVVTTVKYYAKKSASGVSAQFRIFGGRYPGVGAAGSDILTAVTSTSWTQHTLVVQPSEDCIVDIFLEAWGSTTENVTVSGPVSITQNGSTATDPVSRALNAAPYVRSTLVDTSKGNFVYQATPMVSDIFGDDYEYDVLARLKKITHSDQKTTTFLFDDMGNRTNLDTV